MRDIRFRAWTGKMMMYQDKQYLASFIRRVVVQVNLDHENGFQQAHESYLPNGGNINEYLMQFTGLVDKDGKDIYEGDIVTWLNYVQFVRWDSEEAMFLPNHMKWSVKVIGNIYEHRELLERHK